MFGEDFQSVLVGACELCCSVVSYDLKTTVLFHVNIALNFNVFEVKDIVASAFAAAYSKGAGAVQGFLE